MHFLFNILAAALLVEATPAHLLGRQAVTLATSPTASPPPGCTASVSYSFGLAARNVSTASLSKRALPTQISDGQIQVPASNAAVAITSSPPTPVATMGLVAQITDGQIQAALHTMIMMPVANELNDGQIQLQKTVAPVTEYRNGQPQQPTLTSHITSTALAVSERPDGQVIATSIPTPTATAADTNATSPSSSPSDRTQNAMCAGDFSVTLKDTKLTDQAGRTGYIASNFQLQFDQPPQSGALYTSGFTICENGSLALGGSTIFYQCLSGNFYNLYDRKWAAQCSPITVETIKEVTC